MSISNCTKSFYVPYLHCLIGACKKFAKMEGAFIMNDLICYCFGYFEENIRQDYKANGKSTIMERIQTEKKFGNCQCAIKNPTGK